MRFVFGLLLLLGICSLARAGGVCSTSAHHAQAVVLTPAAVVVPLYGAVYAPQQQTQALSDDVLREILLELRNLREEVSAIRENRLPLTMPASAGPVLNGKCAACHGLKVAEAKGAGLVLVDDKGQPWRLSGPEKRAVREQVQTGKMPKGGSLTQQEKAAILNAVK